MKTRIFLFILLAICEVRCDSRLNQSYEELSSDSFYKQSGGYGYIKSSSQSHATIFPKVERYAFNDDYILVMQNPDSVNLRSMIAGELNTGKEKFSNLLKMADSLITNDQYYKTILARDTNYWIIVNRSHTVYGPMSYDEYLWRRDSLNISSDLTLDIK